MHRAAVRSLVASALIGFGAPAVVSAGDVELFIETLEGLIDIDETAALSIFDGGSLASAGGYVTYDAKENNYYSAFPDFTELGSGFIIGVADVGPGLPLKGFGQEVPVLGKFRVTSKETEQVSQNFTYLNERFDIAEKFSWKGKIAGSNGVSVSVKYADKITTFDDKGLNTFTESGSTAISAVGEHKGTSVLSMDELSWAFGEFDRTDGFFNPRPGQWNGPAIFNTTYVTFKGGALGTGGTFSLATKPATEAKFGSYSSKAKIALRSYSEKGLLDLSAAEINSAVFPEDIFADDGDYFNTAVGFRSPAASDSYKVQFVDVAK